MTVTEMVTRAHGDGRSSGSLSQKSGSQRSTGHHQPCSQGSAAALCTVQSENIGQQSSEVSKLHVCVCGGGVCGGVGGVSTQHIHISCFILSSYSSFYYNVTFSISRYLYSHTPVAQKMNLYPELGILLFLMLGNWNGTFCLVS